MCDLNGKLYKNSLTKKDSLEFFEINLKITIATIENTIIIKFSQVFLKNEVDIIISYPS